MSKCKSSENLFKGKQFERKIITLCVRWYLRNKLSYRDLVEVLAERDLLLAHTTFSDVYNALCRNSKNAGIVMPCQPTPLAVSMKPATSMPMANGLFIPNHRS